MLLSMIHMAAPMLAVAHPAVICDCIGGPPVSLTALIESVIASLLGALVL